MQIVKIASGETIQIRTGVLQGIGAQGPVGPFGPQGPPGDQGPQGIQGEMGQIASFSSELRVQSPGTALGADTEGAIAFAITDRDDLGVVTSSTLFTAPAAMDLFFSVWVRFDLPADPGDAYRRIELRTGATVLAAMSVIANPDVSTDLCLTTTYKAAQGQTFQFWGKHSDSVSVAVGAGRLAIYRVGSGPAGVAGPQGAVGPVGPAGPIGPEGPDGSATSGFASFDDLLP